jgi:hypothetical protein
MTLGLSSAVGKNLITGMFRKKFGENLVDE